jgi:rSAM/selenodomain-associated transferase 2
MRLAIVLPVLDEAKGLAPSLGDALREASAPGDEVVVVDGGSRDDTVAVARALGARVVASSPGRGQQLRAGIAATAAEAILVLHADTRLPRGAGDAVRAALASGAVGGAFTLRFDDDRGLLALVARLASWRSRLTRAPLGDQAQFFLRSAHDAVDGFRPWPILEDLDFVRRLARHGRLALLAAAITTSGRRYRERGVLRNVATNWLIWTLFWFGVSPDRLARLYRAVR